MPLSAEGMATWRAEASLPSAGESRTRPAVSALQSAVDATTRQAVTSLQSAEGSATRQAHSVPRSVEAIASRPADCVLLSVEDIATPAGTNMRLSQAARTTRPRVNGQPFLAAGTTRQTPTIASLPATTPAFGLPTAVRSSGLIRPEVFWSPRERTSSWSAPRAGRRSSPTALPQPVSSLRREEVHGVRYVTVTQRTTSLPLTGARCSTGSLAFRLRPGTTRARTRASATSACSSGPGERVTQVGSGWIVS